MNILSFWIDFIPKRLPLFESAANEANEWVQICEEAVATFDPGLLLGGCSSDCMWAKRLPVLVAEKILFKSSSTKTFDLSFRLAGPSAVNMNQNNNFKMLSKIC